MNKRSHNRIIHKPANKKTHSKAIPSDRKVINQALRGINRINPFFHRIRLSSSLTYEKFEDIFPGSIKQPHNSRDIASGQTGKMYRNMAWLWLSEKGSTKKRRISIFYNPTEPFFPKSQLNITNPTIEILADLDKRTTRFIDKPLITLASVEYTVDFHCKTPTDVGNLFYVFRRNYSCPHAKKTYLAGGKFTGYSHEQDYSLDRVTNAVFFIDFSNKHRGMPSKRIKFYERGPDADKLPHNKFWPHDKCDRVRYEATITTRLLQKQNILNIKDFLKNPHFYELLFPSGNVQGLFQFKQFIDKQYRKYVPPTCDEEYFHKDGESMSFECISEELLHAKTAGLDLSNSVENFPKLDHLVNQVKDNIRIFQDIWVKRGTEAIEELHKQIQVQKPENTSSENKPVKRRLVDFINKFKGA